MPQCEIRVGGWSDFVVFFIRFTRFIIHLNIAWTILHHGGKKPNTMFHIYINEGYVFNPFLLPTSTMIWILKEKSVDYFLLLIFFKWFYLRPKRKFAKNGWKQKCFLVDGKFPIQDIGCCYFVENELINHRQVVLIIFFGGLPETIIIDALCPINGP